MASSDELPSSPGMPPAAPRRIVMFGGGSGSRDITMALCRAGHAVTRIVPAWDSGGSSKALRTALGILAMGDIRHALMTMAHGESRVGSVVRFFNARLSETSNRADLATEFAFYISGAHPLLAAMAPGMRGAILNYLRVFQSKVDERFDFCRGSIGNFVLTGAYFAHGRDINTAIFVFRKLCGIDGDVWPSTTDDTVELYAELRDGRVVHGQDRVTALTAEQSQSGIERVRLIGAGSGPPAANPAVLEAIAAADLMLFGPGSFYTSTLAHLEVDGIAEAIAATPARVPKVFVGNILECAETIGRSLAEQAQALGHSQPPVPLTHVLSNRGWVPVERVVKGLRYLREGTWPKGSRQVLPQGSRQVLPQGGPQILSDDFEDPWSRGRHDAAKVADIVRGLLDQFCTAGSVAGESPPPQSGCL